MISVLQATAWYPPSYLGGTEVYLTGLVRELRVRGVASRVIAPAGRCGFDKYEFDGVVVRTYAVNERPSGDELRGKTPHQGFDRFCDILLEEQPDIYHQHSWTRGLGSAHLRAAREAGLKTILTVHTPNVICLRGTMMRFGQHPCDGRIDPPTCAACWSQQRGAPRVVARWLGSMSPRFSAAVGVSMPDSRLATALSARALGERRREEFARLTADADRIVAVSQWVLDALANNGVPPVKLVLSRQGIDPCLADEASHIAATAENVTDEFRLLYLGRWHPVKGVDVLVRAVRSIPAALPLKVSIHGLGEAEEERTYAAQVRRLAEGDARIIFEPPVPRERLASTLARASAIAVPSVYLETGPLIVLEAKAIGVPIIGARLGGIAELVREPEDGVLVPAGDVPAWAAAITTMASNHAKTRRKPELHTIRTMRETAREMESLYSSLLS